MRFISVDSVLGSQSVSVDSLSNKIDASVLKKIKIKSGINSLRICDHNENAETLGKKLLFSNNCNEKITQSDLIVVVSESKSSSIPPISSKIL